MKKEDNSEKKEEKQKNKKQEESELEKEISEEESENTAKEIKEEKVIEEKINNFILQTETKAPVLEKIASEGTSISIQREFEKEERPEKIMKYTNLNELTYNSGREIQEEQEKNYETPLTSLSMQREDFSNSQNFLIRQKSAWEQTKQFSEIPQQAKTMKFERQLLPFEKEKKKYEIR